MLYNCFAAESSIGYTQPQYYTMQAVEKAMVVSMSVFLQAGLHQDAAKLAVGLESQEQALSLEIAIKYEQNDIAGQAKLLPHSTMQPD